MASSVRGKIENAAVSGATKLDLTGCGLTEIPLKVFELTSLQELYLDNNQLITLPASLINLTSLRQLTLYNNPITHVPSILTFTPHIRRKFTIMDNHPQPTSPQDCHNTSQILPLHRFNNTIFTIIPKDVCDLITECLPAITLQVTPK
jgi:Leucine-rich repeat (LRR) protein